MKRTNLFVRKYSFSFDLYYHQGALQMFWIPEAELFCSIQSIILPNRECLCPSVSWYLSKLLVHHSKLEGIVDLVLIEADNQLRRLRTHRWSNKVESVLLDLHCGLVD